MPQQVRITGKFAVGAAGAVGTITAPGVSTIVRLAAGEYRITLSDKFNDLFLESVSLVSSATPGEGEVLYPQFNAYSVANSTVDVVLNPATAVETDPASGDEIHFVIVGKNTSINR
jgi:hypothetical protein